MFGPQAQLTGEEQHAHTEGECWDALCIQWIQLVWLISL